MNRKSYMFVGDSFDCTTNNLEELYWFIRDLIVQRTFIQPNKIRYWISVCIPDWYQIPIILEFKLVYPKRNPVIDIQIESHSLQITWLLFKGFGWFCDQTNYKNTPDCPLAEVQYSWPLIVVIAVLRLTKGLWWSAEVKCYKIK